MSTTEVTESSAFMIISLCYISKTTVTVIQSLNQQIIVQKTTTKNKLIQFHLFVAAVTFKFNPGHQTWYESVQ